MCINDYRGDLVDLCVSRGMRFKLPEVRLYAQIFKPSASIQMKFAGRVAKINV